MNARHVGMMSKPCTTQRPHHSRMFNMVGLVVAVFLLMAVAALVARPTFAFAEEGENLVNPQQRPDSSFIYDTSIASLGSADAYFDNQTVQVVGEAIGDKIRADLGDRYQWITLAAIEKESTATISVFMTDDAASRVDTFGKYGATGTKMQVRGTFHLVCTEHEGLTDLHAEVVAVVEKGRHHESEFNLASFIPGTVMVAVGFGFMGIFYYMRERRR